MKFLALFAIACAALTASPAPVLAQETEKRATGHELCLRWQEQARGMFPVVCADNMSEAVVQRGARDTSDNQLVMLVWGGLDEDRLVALQIVHQMVRDGKSVAIAFGPERRSARTRMDDSEFHIVVEFDFFAHGERATEETNQVVIGSMENDRNAIAQLAAQAYEANFSR